MSEYPEIPPPPGMPGDRRIVDQIAERDRGLVAKVLIGVAVSVLSAIAVGAVTQYAMLEARAAETSQRFSDNERRIDTLEDRFEDLEEVQRNVTALSTKVDAWRQSDTAARAVEREAWERRLSRFERLLEREQGRAGTRRDAH